LYAKVYANRGRLLVAKLSADYLGVIVTTLPKTWLMPEKLLLFTFQSIATDFSCTMALAPTS
jgi:hypothetical protein